MDDIPPLLPPELTPPIRTTDDLHRQWRAMMGPLGFGARSLWFMLLTADGHLTPVVSRIEDLPSRPAGRMVRNLVSTLAEVCEPGGSVALLLTRPGRSQPTADDRAWAVALRKQARRAGLLLQPIFIAADDALDLIAEPDAEAA